MPEINFDIEWSDGTKETCYSPFLVVKKYFTPEKKYDLTEFVNLSETALKIARECVRKAYGFPYSKALRQLQQIELKHLSTKS